MNKETKLLIIGAVILVVLVGAVFAANAMRGNKPTEESSQQTTTQQESAPTKKEVKPPASFAEGYEQVEVGMSKADVEILLGKPMNCNVIDIKQLNKKMETCSYKDPASTAPASLADATVDFSEDGKATQKQRY